MCYNQKAVSIIINLGEQVMPEDTPQAPHKEGATDEEAQATGHADQNAEGGNAQDGASANEAGATQEGGDAQDGASAGGEEAPAAPADEAGAENAQAPAPADAQ